METRTRTAWPWISTAARLGLAAVWLIAGGLKVGDLAASGRAVNAYQLFPYEVAKVIGAVQPFLEIALGLLLLAGLAVRLSAGLSAALLLIFIAGIVSAWARGLQIDCGCFSTGGELGAGADPAYGWDIARDAGFLLLAGLLLWRPRTRFSIDGILMGDGQ
ncbi:MauE/DoxX family redox-associated membrane protein [Couchioplanes caeruleus]|uniref:DoxX family protein n=2 Tax=Couchioplanes caeruleus TaxID=56438 RepID=A0A1K0GGL2_9ACTN|nr:MauE/DoxX family redox-associated membrane protein [Couchioplanes caeruleus]OJF11326.1 DoxX family protein [Couchioplanes caeruleus subsp. caeruleus]ROP29876.1 methylamine utilization protein MauE [Couchioplanes caeruleus]